MVYIEIRIGMLCTDAIAWKENYSLWILVLQTNIKDQLERLCLKWRSFSKNFVVISYQGKISKLFYVVLAIRYFFKQVLPYSQPGKPSFLGLVIHRNRVTADDRNPTAISMLLYPLFRVFCLLENIKLIYTRPNGIFLQKGFWFEFLGALSKFSARISSFSSMPPHHVADLTTS